MQSTILLTWKQVKRIRVVSGALVPILLVVASVSQIFGLVPDWIRALMWGVSWSALIIYVVSAVAQQAQSIFLQREKIGKLEEKALQEPEKARYAWDLAKAKLEDYFDRNLIQIKAIFWVAVGVMLAGFGFIVWALKQTITTPGQTTVAIIGAASGVITQFIGLTFMVIYRSTMLQATQFMTVLERINTVGMAVQILDAMEDKAGELKDVTRVDIIRLLLAHPGAELEFSPRSRKKKSGDKPDAKGEAAGV